MQQQQQLSRAARITKRLVSISIAALVLGPLTFGWLIGMIVFSYQSGYASAAQTLLTWSGGGKAK